MFTQADAAQRALLKWLSHPCELGRKPKEIECMGNFMLNDLRYYYFRYKINADEPWMLGVVGGYEENDMNHCGHVSGGHVTYDDDTAIEDSIDIIETIIEYWKKRAEM